MSHEDFRNKQYDVFNMFDRQWAIAAAGSEKDFDGCTIGWGALGDIWGTVNKGKLIVTIYVNPLSMNHTEKTWESSEANQDETAINLH